MEVELLSGSYDACACLYACRKLPCKCVVVDDRSLGLPNLDVEGARATQTRAQRVVSGIISLANSFVHVIERRLILTVGDLKLFVDDDEIRVDATIADTLIVHHILQFLWERQEVEEWLARGRCCLGRHLIHGSRPGSVEVRCWESRLERPLDIDTLPKVCLRELAYGLHE